MGHVVFESTGAQLTGDPLLDQGVYEWADGQVRLVSKLPVGCVPASAIGGGGHRSGGNHPGGHVISDDGQRIFFTRRAGRRRRRCTCVSMGR